MTDEYDVAGGLLISLSLLRRRLQQLPVGDREITNPEMSAMVRLERGGAQTSAELAKTERISPQSMGATVASLEAKGLISRSEDPDDGRRILLALTRVGQTAVAQRRAARRQQVGAVVADFEPEEIEVLRQAAPLIERLADAL